MFTADSHCDTLWALKKGNDLSTLMVNRQKMELGGMGMHTFALFTGSRGTNGTAYRKMDRLYEFYALAGIRMITLTWNFENEIGYPAKLGSKPGLKPFGLRLLKEMDKLGIYADVSHLNEAGFWDICENMNLPPIASHSNNRELCDVPRNLYKAQIKAIIEKKGYIGINFYTAFLTKADKSNLGDVLRHIDSIYELGGEDVLGFGSDFDGIDSWPEGLYDSSCFPALIDALLRHGYSEQAVSKMAGGNLWRLLKRGDALRSYDK